MIYNVGVEDIEPNHWVAWSFDRPGLTGKGKTQDAALVHLQSLLPDGELHVAEEFAGFLSPQDPNILSTPSLKMIGACSPALKSAPHSTSWLSLAVTFWRSLPMCRQKS